MIRIAAQGAAGSAAEGPPRHEPTALQTATAGMAHALRGMALLGSGPAPPNEAAAAWADEDYLYIEARLPEDLGTCIDISACGHTFMVRIARWHDPGSRAVMPPGGDAGPDGASPGAA